MLLDLIGLISGVLGVVGFIQDQLPDKPEPENPDDPNKYGINLRLTVGLAGVTPPEGGDPLAEPDGMINQVAHYDNAGNIIVGIAAPGMIEDGHFTDIKVMSTNGRQAAVTTVWGTPQNVCIATMGITFSDGTRFGWVGDWGKICHLPSYYSGIILENGEVPYCTWLSWVGEESTPAHKLTIEWAKFRLASEEDAVPTEEEAQQFCGGAFKAWNVGTDANDRQILEPGNEDPKRSFNFPINGRSDDRLIISSRRGQNATTLCEQDTSYGPDFVSLEEGVYCNMETRATLPICTAGVLGECFDLDTASHIATSGKTKRTIEARNPTSVIRWD